MPVTKILIVDDDADIRRGLNVRLRASGYDTVYAEDALGAIMTAQKERPDLILLDLGLPCGDGFSVLERRRELPALADIPVIVVTARDDNGQSERRALALGAVGFFQKPVEHAALLSAIACSGIRGAEVTNGPATTAAPVAAKPATNGDKTILIVDDDADIRLGLSVRLRAGGFRVVSAEDAVGVVPIALREKPSLVLLDLGLPGGDGFLVMERLRNLPPLAGLPVIVFSARDPHTNRDRALQRGAHAYFQKPVDNHELLTSIHQALSPA